MSTYFKDEYKKYYEKLNNNSSLTTKASNIQNKSDLLITIMNRLKNKFSEFDWNELYCTELKNNVLPSLKKRIEIFAKNIEDGLVQAVNSSINELLPKLKELKTIDEEYDNIVSYLSNNSNANNISIYTNKKSDCEKKLIELNKEIESIISKIKGNNLLKELNVVDASIRLSSLNGLDKKSITNEIKRISNQKYNYSFAATSTQSITNNKNDSVQTEKTRKIEKTSKIEKTDEKSSSVKTEEKIVPINIPTQSLEKISDPPKVEAPQIVKINTSNTIAPGKTATWSTLGANWTIVNTKIDVATYATTAYNKGIRQDSNSARYGNLCMAFSYVHASNLYNGSTQDNAESAYNWKHASEFKDVMSDNKNDILNAIYYEIMNGRPCVVQVNGNSSGTSRHFATVVGIKDTVKSAQDLTEDDLLIIDSWDCKVERMDTETSRFLTNGKQTGNGYTGYYLRVLKT